MSGFAHSSSCVACGGCFGIASTRNLGRGEEKVAPQQFLLVIVLLGPDLAKGFAKMSAFQNLRTKVKGGRESTVLPITRPQRTDTLWVWKRA